MHLYGYRILERKSTAPHGDVYFAVRERDGLPVVLKASSAHPGGEPSRARREFELLSRIDSERVVRAVDLEHTDGLDVLVIERHTGCDLSELAAKRTLSPREFLEIAAQCAEALADIHAARIIHKDIKPGNLLVDPDSLALRVIDFGISSELGEAQRPNERVRVEGTLAYLSPEQTGRIDTGLDFRSDLYSLGATLYDLLTGRPPFDDGSPDEIVYAHIAQTPPSPIERNPSVPETLSRIVMRLLEKDPEERYQTARGLRADLVECLKQWIRSGSIEADFALGSHDAPNRLRFPKRLYGRREPLAALRAALAEAQAGRPTFVLLIGAPGIGKTALAESIRAPLAEKGGSYARAKFDRYRRDRPYAGFVDACEGVFEQILAASKETLDAWRSSLTQALGDQASELTEIFPSLGMILQEQADPPKLPAHERQARLGATVRRMVRALATPAHPLALVFDDLQWADAGSRFLFEELIADKSAAHLLVIATLRASGRDRIDPWLESLEALHASPDTFREIQVGPLTDADITEWLAELLGRPADEVGWLTRRVALRSGRCPQLIHEFLVQLQDCGALQAGPDGWHWDEVAADAAAMSDQAVGFATAAIDNLPGSARRLLAAASCIGDVFDPEFLLEVVGADRVHGFRDLMTLSTACFIAPCRDGFRFVHDRLRETASHHLEPKELQTLHLRIGDVLLRRTHESQLPQQAMRIADHLNRGGDPIQGDERLRRMRVNLLAGTQALDSHSAASAEQYIRTALAFFVEEDWQSHPTLGFDLYFRLVQCSALGGSPDQAERYLSFLETRPLDPVSWARVAARRIELRTTTHGPGSGIEAGLKALAKLGVRFPATSSRLALRIEVMRTFFALRSPRSLVPESQPGVDAQWSATQLIVSAMGPATFREELRLHLRVICHFIRGQIARRAGVPPLSLISLAHSQAVVTGDYASAVRLGEIALKRAIELDQPRNQVQVRHIMNVLIHPWWMPRREILDHVQRVTNDCFDLGVRELALYSQLWHAMLLLTLGEPLSLAERELSEHLPLSKRIAPTSWALRLGILHALAPLTGSPGSSRGATGSVAPTAGSELPSEVSVLLANSRHYTNIIGMVHAMVLYLLGQADEAYYRCQQLARSMLWAGGATPHVSEFELFYGLSAAALASQSRGRTRAHALRDLTHNLRAMERHARAAPFNFEHLASLLRAERHAVRGAHAKAERHYRQAAERATEHRYPNHLAIIHERLAHLLATTGQRAAAVELRSLAAQGYESWGAHVKVAQLRRAGTRLP